jgi:nuclear RNA export factor
MAPPTGPRATRGNQPNHRGSRGGGIGKRRGPSRTDRDGDVSMDSVTGANPPTGPSSHSSRGSRGNRGNRGGRGGRVSARLAQNVRNYVSEQDGTASGGKAQYNKVTLKIHGLKDSKAAGNSDGGLRSLLDFLERKASKERPVILGRGVIRGDYVWLKVNQVDATHLLRLNGFTYAGAPLAIEQTSDPIPGQNGQPTDAPESKTSETKDKLLEVLSSRYVEAQRFLDLSMLAADPTLRSMGAFESKALAEKSFKALMRLTATHYDNPAEKEAGIQAVTIANNDIHDVYEVFALAPTLPHLRRLDLSGNKLEDMSKISKWRHEFRRLEELHVAGNPIANLPNYPTQMIEWFPSLQVLDGRRVRTPEEAAEAFKSWFPTPLPRLPSNLRDGGNNVASTFLHGFFMTYDNDRTSLVRQFYDEESTFSLHTAAEPAQNAYNNFSRNLETTGVRGSSIQQRLFTGSNLIAELWAQLPPTRHPSLDLAHEWQVDCHTFPSLADPTQQQELAMGLAITVCSRLEEVDPTRQLPGTRQFFRSFILGPSKPGAPHPYRVVSDELALQTWVPQQTPTAAVQAPTSAPVSTIPLAAQPPVLDDALRAQMIEELCRQTGMTPEYSQLCLAGEADWNFDLALKSFHEKRGGLPPEAFVSSV